MSLLRGAAVLLAMDLLACGARNKVVEAPTLPPANPGAVSKMAQGVEAAKQAEGKSRAIGLFEQAVKADARLGGQLGVNQTPTFYINGRKVPWPALTPPQYFDYLVELSLKQSK